jgi:hypothetical protein
MTPRAEARQRASQACSPSRTYCFSSVATVTCGQRRPLKSSWTSWVYCNWSVFGPPPSPSIASIQKITSTSTALALPPGGSWLLREMLCLRSPSLDGRVLCRDRKNHRVYHFLAFKAFLEEAVRVDHELLGHAGGGMTERSRVAKLSSVKIASAAPNPEWGCGRADAERNDVVVRDRRPTKDRPPGSLRKDHGAVRDRTHSPNRRWLRRIRRVGHTGPDSRLNVQPFGCVVLFRDLLHVSHPEPVDVRHQ